MSVEATEARRLPGWKMEVLGEMPGTANPSILRHVDKDRWTETFGDIQFPT